MRGIFPTPRQDASATVLLLLLLLFLLLRLSRVWLGWKI